MEGINILQEYKLFHVRVSKEMIEASLLRLVSAIEMEISEDWIVSKR